MKIFTYLLLRLVKLKYPINRFDREIKIYKLVLKDSETPLVAKIILGFTIVYALSPIDIIPDFIPVLGRLDDAIVLPLLFLIATKLIPKEIVERHRNSLTES